jgi:hypothetical protein
MPTFEFMVLDTRGKGLPLIYLSKVPVARPSFFREISGVRP